MLSFCASWCVIIMAAGLFLLLLILNQFYYRLYDIQIVEHYTVPNDFLRKYFVAMSDCCVVFRACSQLMDVYVIIVMVYYGRSIIIASKWRSPTYVGFHRQPAWTWLCMGFWLLHPENPSINMRYDIYPTLQGLELATCSMHKFAPNLTKIQASIRGQTVPRCSI